MLPLMTYLSSGSFSVGHAGIRSLLILNVASSALGGFIALKYKYLRAAYEHGCVNGLCLYMPVYLNILEMQLL